MLRGMNLEFSWDLDGRKKRYIKYRTYCTTIDSYSQLSRNKIAFYVEIKIKDIKISISRGIKNFNAT